MREVPVFASNPMPRPDPPRNQDGGEDDLALNISIVCPTCCKHVGDTINISDVIPTSSKRNGSSPSLWPTLMPSSGSGMASVGSASARGDDCRRFASQPRTQSWTQSLYMFTYSVSMSCSAHRASLCTGRQKCILRLEASKLPRE